MKPEDKNKRKEYEMTKPEQTDPPETPGTTSEGPVPEDEPVPGSEESHLDQVVRRLWELRERDASAVAELSARVEKFEAVFESCWSLIRRLEVKQGDLATLIEHHGVMIDQIRNTSAPDPAPNAEPCGITSAAANPSASGRSPRPQSTAVREPEQHPATRTPESRTPARSRWVRFDDFLTDNDHAPDRWDPPEW